MSRIPAHLLSGFLGSGKTTLLNRLLKHPAFANTAVVVNEVGEIGLDHYLIAESSDNVVLLESGCLCCTIADSLHETLAALHARRARGEIPAFERVIIETTGLADPAPIVNTLIGNRLVTDHYRFEGLVVTVDARNALATMDSHPEVVKQIGLADRLAWTKRDVCEATPELQSRIEGLNALAERVDARDAAAVASAFSPGAPRSIAAPDPGALWLPKRTSSRHDSRLRSHAFVLPAPPSWAGVAAWWRLASERFGDRLLRCKGLVEIADTGEIVFLQTVQRVFHTPERLPAWPDADHRSRLVCITYDVDRDLLESTLPAFAAAAGTTPF